MVTPVRIDSQEAGTGLFKFKLRGRKPFREEVPSEIQDRSGGPFQHGSDSRVFPAACKRGLAFDRHRNDAHFP